MAKYGSRSEPGQAGRNLLQELLDGTINLDVRREVDVSLDVSFVSRDRGLVRSYMKVQYSFSRTCTNCQVTRRTLIGAFRFAAGSDDSQSQRSACGS